MVRNELIKKVAEKLPLFFEKDVERSVRTIINAMSDSLAEGGRIEIRGFGSFYLKEYGKRKAINPQTGNKVDLHPRKMPHFRISKTLHSIINDKQN